MALLCGLLDAAGGEYTLDANDIFYGYSGTDVDAVVFQDPWMYRFTLREKDDQGGLRNSSTG